MRLRPSLLLVGFLASALAPAQNTAHLEFDSTKHCIVFVSAKPPTVKPDDTQDINGPSADVTVPTTGTLYVWDRDSGNIAAKPLDQVGKNWHLSDKDFDRIGLVTVRVEYQGEPVAAARIVLRDKTREQSQVLDQSAKGEADFYLVQAGTETVTVEYRSGDSPAQPLVQQFSLDLSRKTPDPLLKVELPNEVQTIDNDTAKPTRTTTSPTSASPTPVIHSNPIGSFFVFIFTLAVATGLAYGLYLLAKKYPLWLKSKLQKLGIDVPDAPEPAEPSAEKKPLPDLVPPKPKAPSKIILADSDIGSAPTPVAITTTTHEPHLVKSSGEIVNLIEGETVVGREELLGVSLVGESSVSRRHASIQRKGSTISVQDLGSTNGTFVNGRRISDTTPLHSGDDVQFGAIRFRVDGA